MFKCNEMTGYNEYRPGNYGRRYECPSEMSNLLELNAFKWHIG